MIRQDTSRPHKALLGRIRPNDCRANGPAASKRQQQKAQEALELRGQGAEPAPPTVPAEIAALLLFLAAPVRDGEGSECGSDDANEAPADAAAPRPSLASSVSSRSRP